MANRAAGRDPRGRRRCGHRRARPAVVAIGRRRPWLTAIEPRTRNRADLVNGHRLRLPAPGRPRMVMFSSSICTSCFVSASFMGDYKHTHPGVDAAFVSVDDSPHALNDRRAALGDRAFPFAIDPSGELFASYRVTSLGTVVFYDRAGNIRRAVIEPSLVDIENACRKTGAS
jgi:hypothetical protein